MLGCHRSAQPAVFDPAFQFIFSVEMILRRPSMHINYLSVPAALKTDLALINDVADMLLAATASGNSPIWLSSFCKGFVVLLLHCLQ
ncbi:MAG: hypothetical protein IPL32_19755 [Chloracidobacterium sp.]|nr:hypothetical protein [Chloracidobacterium sp.]